MAHCSFSFLMELYSACREKSRESAGAWCQVRGAALGHTEGMPGQLRGTGG